MFLMRVMKEDFSFWSFSGASLEQSEPECSIVSLFVALLFVKSACRAGFSLGFNSAIACLKQKLSGKVGLALYG